MKPKINKAEQLVIQILVAIIVFGTILLIGSSLSGCGNRNDVTQYRGMDCASRCQDTGRDVKIFWQYTDAYGTVSVRCECT